VPKRSLSVIVDDEKFTGDLASVQWYEKFMSSALALSVKFMENFAYGGKRLLLDSTHLWMGTGALPK